MTQLIDVLAGPPGAGKTTLMIERIVATPSRYLLACPRIELIKERVADLRRYAASHGMKVPIIVEAHSKTGEIEAVGRQLSDARERHEGTSHVVILTTHQALIEVDFSSWGGWHVRLDEVPMGVKAHAWSVPASSFLFAALFDLVAVAENPGWWAIRPKETCPSLSQLMRDQCLKDVPELYKAAQSPQGAFTTTGAWSDLQGAGRKFEWASIWTLHELRAFESCVVAAAGYRHSVTGIVSSALHPGKLVVRETVVPASAPPSARIRITYFTRHRGSTHYWRSDPDGRECIRKVAAYLATQRLGYWATNIDMVPEFAGLSGQHVSPKTEGTNALRGHTSCSFVYSSKRQPADKLLQRLVAALTDELIERAREIEDVVQFVFRGAIRMPRFDGCYDVFVYEERQAEALRNYCEGLGFSVELVACHEAGIMDVSREVKKSRPTDRRSMAERDEARRAKDRDRQRLKRKSKAEDERAAGTYRRRGRPKSHMRMATAPDVRPAV